MKVSRHLDRARVTLGAVRVEEALAAVAGLPRHHARPLILEALGDRG